LANQTKQSINNKQSDQQRERERERERARGGRQAGFEMMTKMVVIGNQSVYHMNRKDIIETIIHTAEKPEASSQETGKIERNKTKLEGE